MLGKKMSFPKLKATPFPILVLVAVPVVQAFPYNAIAVIIGVIWYQLSHLTLALEYGYENNDINDCESSSLFYLICNC